MRRSRRGSPANHGWDGAVRQTTTRVTTTPVAVAAACAALLLTAGCGGAQNQRAQSDPPAAQPSTQAPKSKQQPGEPTPPGAGTVKIRYEDATTPEAQRGRQLMQDAK